jgi:Cu/Zn superoxide dismutase
MGLGYFDCAISSDSADRTVVLMIDLDDEARRPDGRGRGGDRRVCGVLSPS